MKKPFGLVVLAIFAVAGLSVAGDPMKDLAALQGNWKVLSIKESDPAKSPPDEVVKDFTVNFKGDIMKITSQKNKGEAVVVFKVVLNAAKQPKTIDFIHQEGEMKGKSEPGIYKIEGNTVTLCNDDVGKERPKAFATKEGSTISVIVLQKAK